MSEKRRSSSRLQPPPPRDVFDALTLAALSSRCLATGALLTSLEVLAVSGELSAGHLLQSTRRVAPSRVASFERWWSEPQRVVFMMALRAIAAAGCIWLPFTSPATPWLLGTLLASQAYYNRRFAGQISHSSDAMSLFGFAAMLTASLDPADVDFVRIGLIFLALQVLFAYARSGFDKIRSPVWRNGQMLTMIFTAGPWRQESAGRLLAGSPSAATAASWAVMMLELALPVAVLLPTLPFLLVLVLGVGFHLSIAALMGLHPFLWSFLAGYPAIVFLHQAIREFAPSLW